MEIKPCPHCGHELPTQLSFCPYCMTKLAQEQVISVPKRRHRRLSALVLTFAAAALCVALVAGVIVLSLGNRSAQQNDVSVEAGTADRYPSGSGDAAPLPPLGTLDREQLPDPDDSTSAGDSLFYGTAYPGYLMNADLPRDNLYAPVTVGGSDKSNSPPTPVTTKAVSIGGSDKSNSPPTPVTTKAVSIGGSGNNNPSSSAETTTAASSGGSRNDVDYGSVMNGNFNESCEAFYPYIVRWNQTAAALSCKQYIIKDYDPELHTGWWGSTRYSLLVIDIAMAGADKIDRIEWRRSFELTGENSFHDVIVHYNSSVSWEEHKLLNYLTFVTFSGYRDDSIVDTFYDEGGWTVEEFFGRNLTPMGKHYEKESVYGGWVFGDWYDEYYDIEINQKFILENGGRFDWGHDFACSYYPY